ncbi:Nn.00g036630.m01.CDS01 [Neocucurbitaria sp. VM-36]
MDLPSSLARDISPPRPLKRRRTPGRTTPLDATTTYDYPKPTPSTEPTLAAVEAGKAKVDDHLTYFKDHLAKASRKTASETPRLSISNFSTLYQNNYHENGNHFVIHQHNHPRAGVHYDLRLQFSESSSMSFAVPKGLPGDPNSRSIGRMAIETRVHNYWNHLIESASAKTGSLLIWDTGTYEVLPRKSTKGRGRNIPIPVATDDEGGSSTSEDDQYNPTPPLHTAGTQSHDNAKLVSAFQTRYIRLRFHGTRLPKNYTIILRLSTNEIIRRPPARRKKHRQPHKSKSYPNTHFKSNSTDSEHEPTSKTEVVNQAEEDLNTDSEEDAQTRATNAYPGSTNDIGSIHQRHWFLQLDRQNSGFVLEKEGDSSKGRWVRGPDGGGFEAFLVRGRDFERSVVTGRLARDVESDEGVEGFVGRGGWVGIER